MAKAEHPLLECLAILARERGHRTNVAALTAGLPPPKDGLVTPELFTRAAARANMEAQAVRRALADLVGSSALPCILILKDRRACVLKALTADKATVTFPDAPGKTEVLPIEELEKQHDGYAFFLRSHAVPDERGGPAPEKSDKAWFWDVIRKNRRIHHQVILSALMINLFALIVPLFTMTVYDRILPNKAVDTLWVLAIGVTISLGFDFVLKNLRARFLDAAGQKSDIRISANIFEHIQNMKMSARPASAGVLVDSMRGFETLRDFFTSATVTTLVDLPFMLLFIFLVGLLGGPVVIVPIALVVVIVGFGLGLQKHLSKSVEQNARENAVKNSVLMETLSGLETIKVRSAEGFNQRKWEDLVEQASRSSVRSRALAGIGANFTGLAANLCTVGVMLYGVNLFAEGAMTSGALIACVIISGRIIQPLAQISGVMTRFNQSRTALDRLDTMMQAPLEREPGRAFIPKPEIKGHVVFRDLTFRYPGQQNDALKQVTMEIKPGDRVGIIGAVGSGKTTLQRLLLNLYQPQHGSVEVDGLDARQIDPADLRRSIGVAQQDGYMFFGSVRDNITLGDETVPEIDILRAAEQAGVTEFLRESPAGLDTPVGERGERLSGGQRQSIALARALLYDPPILILDEPTASIDPKSEKRLYQRLLHICEGKTVILITHRHEMLGLIEKLALMDRGQVVAYGPRDAVIKGLQEKQYNPAGKP